MFLTNHHHAQITALDLIFKLHQMHVLVTYAAQSNEIALKSKVQSAHVHFSIVSIDLK